MNHRTAQFIIAIRNQQVANCEKRLALALNSGEDAPVIIAMMQDNLDRALCEQTILRNTKLSELA